MSMLDLIAAERARRNESKGCRRFIIETDEQETTLNETLATGRIRGPIIVRRIVTSPANSATDSLRNDQP